MTKKPIIIANWKMKLQWNEAVDLARGIVNGVEELDLKNVPEIVLCPSYTAMSKVRKILGLGFEMDSERSEIPALTRRLRRGGRNPRLDSPSSARRAKSETEITDSRDIQKNQNKASGIKLGAQDVFWEENGAYTGEISIEMLRNLKCEYFIIGHSERRQYLGETNEMVNKKLKRVLESGGTPIICVGETQEERRQGKKDSTVVNQVIKAFDGIKLKNSQRVIIAYEPVWVIGTGQAMKSEDAEYMANLIRQVALDFCGEDDLDIIYGGSVDSGNIETFIEREMINGFLVGSAALDVHEFLRMINIIAN